MYKLIFEDIDMLIELEVGNFLSFKAPVRLSMRAATPIKEFQKENVIMAGRYRLLKSAVIYGANASGKSNLLNAFVHMRWLVLNSSKEMQAAEPIRVTPFKLDVGTESQPSRFEAVFLIDQLRYRYGFEADTKRVQAEWLFQSSKRAELPLFMRKGDEIEVADRFKEGRGLEVRTRDNALFLSVVAQFNGATAIQILGWFAGLYLLHGLQHERYAESSIAMLQDQTRRGRLVELVRKADLGIEDLHAIEEKADDAELLSLLSAKGKKRFLRDVSEAREFSVASTHAKFSKGARIGTTTLDIDTEESEGTKKFFHLAGLILDCLDEGGVAIVDELDAKLHPLLTKAIVRLFNSKETNPRNAQLIFGTHDTNLLQYGGFRRDQVWFVEKDHEGATDLYSLAEIKLPKGTKVRNDAALAKNYIQGRYGAIPYLGPFDELFVKDVDGQAGKAE